LIVKKQSYSTTDGLLNLTVDSVSWIDFDGSDQTAWLVRFLDCQWRIDNEELEDKYTTTLDNAVHRFVDSILQDQFLLRLQYFGGKLYDARVIDDQEAGVDHLLLADQAGLYTGERIVYRYWSGRVIGQAE